MMKMMMMMIIVFRKGCPLVHVNYLVGKNLV